MRVHRSGRVPAIPKDMMSAVAAMQDHAAVREGLGGEFVMVYCENKRQEQLDFMN
ncbi:hypothetical protein G3N57_32660, partial [Paraburkholderia sp. Se-20369]|nr:hypothetical protein [Paraburkholderia sp. Se-20369]